MRLAGKMYAWFPLAKEILRMEKLCRLVGFDEWQTATLISGKLLLSINRVPGWRMVQKAVRGVATDVTPPYGRHRKQDKRNWNNNKKMHLSAQRMRLFYYPLAL